MRRLPTSTRALGSRFNISGHKRLAAAFAIVAAILVAAVAGILLLRPFDAVHADQIQGGLDHPWDIAFTDDRRMLVTERIGRVRVYASGEPGAALLDTATIPDVRAELESGLMGIAIRGDAVFVCASRDHDGAWSVELMRSTLGGDSLPFALRSRPDRRDDGRRPPPGMCRRSGRLGSHLAEHR